MVDEDRARWEKNLRFGVEQVDGEDGHKYDFTIICNGKRLVVTVCLTHCSESPGPKLISQYAEAFRKDDDENLEKAEDEIVDIIYEAGWRKFALLAPGIEKGPSDTPISLHSALNPDTFYFRLVTNGGNADVVQEYPSRSKYVSFHLALKVAPNLPQYAAREILFTKRLMGAGYIAKVSVNGQDMCCKMMTSTHGRAVQREYECLKKIADSKHASSIRAPRLIGLVSGDGDEGFIGILEEYVPHVMTLGRLQGDIKDVASGRRRKWAEQIVRALSFLHEIGVVWGDGKPENILINSETDDCYLIDFGGSWTDGWIDAKLMETKAGDEQALSRILDFLCVLH